MPQFVCVYYRFCRRLYNLNFFLPQLTYRLLEKGKFYRSLPSPFLTSVAALITNILKKSDRPNLGRCYNRHFDIYDWNFGYFGCY